MWSSEDECGFEWLFESESKRETIIFGCVVDDKSCARKLDRFRKGFMARESYL